MFVKREVQGLESVFVKREVQGLESKRGLRPKEGAQGLSIVQLNVPKI